MLAIQVDLLTGRYCAGSIDNRRLAEWPPEPARLFYAAVDSVFSVDEVGAEEVALLEWWEALPAPSICCSDLSETGNGGVRADFTVRSAVDHYVPGNSGGSWTAGLDKTWHNLVDAEARIHTAVGDRETAKATKALEKVRAKVRADVARVTRPKGVESATVTEQVVELLPENRNRQARQFPTVTPDQPTFWFVWADTDADETRRGVLDRILARIARLGHSSSLVSCRVLDESDTAPDSFTWIPTTDQAGADHRLRTTAPGLLRALQREYARHQGSRERVLPAVLTPYHRSGVTPPARPPRQRYLGEWLVLPFEKARLPLSRTQDVTRAVRAAVIAHATEPVPSVISGHMLDADGRNVATDSPHMSVLVLPNVTHVYSDGTIQAVAIALPDTVSPVERRVVLAAVQRWSEQDERGLPVLRLRGGSAHRLRPVTVDRGDSSARTSRVTVPSREFWARVSDRWSTVTPVALDRHPKAGQNPSYEELNEAIAPIVARMCEQAGLPEPIEIAASPTSVWSAVAPVAARGRRHAGQQPIPQYTVGGQAGRGRFTTHLTIQFAEPVQGPLVLGAGRYFGYGLLLPTPGMREIHR